MIDETKIRTILLLDDEPSVLFALKLLIQAVGYSVADFHVPEEALAYLQAGKNCDLMLSDLRMPRLSGLDVLRLTRNINAKLPFILMSAHAQEEDRQKAAALGSSGFLSKPFSPDELRRLIETIELRRSA